MDKYMYDVTPPASPNVNGSATVSVLFMGHSPQQDPFTKQAISEGNHSSWCDSEKELAWRVTSVVTLQCGAAKSRSFGVSIYRSQNSQDNFCIWLVV